MPSNDSNQRAMTAAPDPQGSEVAECGTSEVAIALAGLDSMESVFLSGLLEGATPDDAARQAGWNSRAIGAKVLGRPRVRLAIQRVAPLLEAKQGARLLAPYLLERVARVALEGSDAQAVAASRDLLNLAGLGPVSRSETVHASLSDVLGALDRRRDNGTDRVVDAKPRKP